MRKTAGKTVKKTTVKNKRPKGLKVPKYRELKRNGKSYRGFVEIGSRKKRERIYFPGPYSKDKNSESYRAYLKWCSEYLVNDGKAPPVVDTNATISVEELAHIYLRYAESEYADQYTTIHHYVTAATVLIEYFGSVPVNSFGAPSMKHIQTILVEKGARGKPYARPMVKRIMNHIRRIFEHGVELGVVTGATIESIKCVKKLRKGKTTAREYNDIEPMANGALEATVSYVSITISAMARLQYKIGGRCQDIINLRLRDIENRQDGAWVYTPFKHKTMDTGHVLVKAVNLSAQKIIKEYLAVLASYSIVKNPDDFLFSPADAKQIYYAELRKNRKTPVQPSQVKRAALRQKNSKHRLRKPTLQYTTSEYGKQIAEGLARAKKAGVIIEKWTPGQIRHKSATDCFLAHGGDLRALELTSYFLGHSNIETTKNYLGKIAKVACSIEKTVLASKALE